jgi:hypothetical protein
MSFPGDHVSCTSGTLDSTSKFLRIFRRCSLCEALGRRVQLRAVEGSAACISQSSTQKAASGLGCFYIAPQSAF